MLRNSSYVCELHFLPEAIENTFSGLCNGVPRDVTALKRVSNKLRPGPVPLLWPGMLCLH